jgi:Flp pilus assembly protein TadD
MSNFQMELNAARRLGRNTIVIVSLCSVLVACKTSQPTQGTSIDKQPSKRPRLAELIKQAQAGLNSQQEQYEAFLAAERLATQKEFAAAEILYQGVYDRAPTLVTGLSLARILAYLGKNGEAENVVRKVHLLFPDDPQPKLAEAYLAQIRGAPEEALALYRQTYEEHADDEEVAARYVEALLAAERKQEAEKILRTSIGRIPDSPYFLLKLARIKFQEKKFTEAKTLLDGLLRVDPDNIEGWTLAGFIALEEKKEEDAESYFRSAYEKQPENDTLAKYYVAQLLKLNRLEEAMRLLTRIEQGDSAESPVDPDLKFQHAAVLFQLKDYQNARDRFVALAIGSEDPGRMFFFAGQCEENMKRFEEAVSFYSKVEKQSSYFLQSLQRRMIAYLELGQPEQTRSLLEEFEKVSDQKSPSIRFHASVLARLRDYKSAVQVLKSAPGTIRKDPEVRYLEAVYTEHNVDQAASLLALEKLIKDHPDFSPALNHLGYTLVEKGIRLDFATKLLERATTLEPDNGYYLDSLGWAYFKIGNYEAAEQRLLKALELEPTEPVILEHLGELKIKQERLDLALRYFERAMGIFDNSPPWKVSSDDEWVASKERVQKRIDELMRLAMPKVDPKQ